MKRIRLTHVKGATVEREFIHCDQCDRELGKYEIGESPSEPHLCNTEICKMKTPPTPTIAELWDRFKKLGDYIETEKILHSWGTKGSDGLSHDGRNHSADEIELHELRQQLLERCKEPLQTFNGKITIRLLLDGACINIRPFAICTPSDLAEIEAMVGFVRLELEQRQREKEAKNEN